MREAILNTYVACTCASCGKTYRRQAYRVFWESVTAQEAYRKELENGLCPDCRAKQDEHDRVRILKAWKEAATWYKPKKRRTAADIIQEYNLKHLHDKKRRKK